MDTQHVTLGQSTEAKVRGKGQEEVWGDKTGRVEVLPFRG